MLAWPAPLLPTLPGTGPVLKLYDTPRGEVVATSPDTTARMYVCGITPYDATHLGHAATFINYDVLQRRLIDLGHTVKCVRNVTDVDDPLFAKARELGVHYLDLAAGEEARFERDMTALNDPECSFLVQFLASGSRKARRRQA